MYRFWFRGNGECENAIKVCSITHYIDSEEDASAFDDLEIVDELYFRKKVDEDFMPTNAVVYAYNTETDTLFCLDEGGLYWFFR